VKTEAPLRIAEPVGASSAIRSGPHVLVVEDNQVNRLVAERLLQRLGCTVDLAVNGVEALSKSQANRYDLILMDVHMPEMNGLEATARIRTTQSADNRCPIVAMTASAMSIDRERCLSAGMDDFFVKPVQLEDLHVLLRRHLPVAIVSDHG
jgi:CheY-like chemotaxis protein